MELQGKSVLIKPDSNPEKTKGGIVIADTVKNRNNTGIVVDIGIACEEVRKGDKVYYPFNKASLYEKEGVEYHFIMEHDIYGSISE